MYDLYGLKWGIGCWSGCECGLLYSYHQFLDRLGCWHQFYFGFRLDCFCIQFVSILIGDYDLLGYWCCYYGLLGHYFYFMNYSCWGVTHPWSPQNTYIDGCQSGPHLWQSNFNSQHYFVMTLELLWDKRGEAVHQWTPNFWPGHLGYI